MSSPRKAYVSVSGILRVVASERKGPADLLESFILRKKQEKTDPKN